MNHWTFSISDVAHGLENLSWRDTQKFIACCPAHDDHNPSLSVEEVAGKVLVHCHAGCSQDEVISALRNRGNWPDYSHKSPKIKISLDAIWKQQMSLAMEVARYNQGIPHTEEEKEQIEAIVRFLESLGYE